MTQSDEYSGNNVKGSSRLDQFCDGDEGRNKTLVLELAAISAKADFQPRLRHASMKHFASSGMTRTLFRSRRHPITRSLDRITASFHAGAPGAIEGIHCALHLRLTRICSGLPIVASPRSANHRAANRADCSALAGVASNRADRRTARCAARSASKPFTTTHRWPRRRRRLVRRHSRWIRSTPLNATAQKRCLL